MSTVQNAESVPHENYSLTSESIYKVADSIGVIGKLTTLAMLDITPDDYVSRAGLGERLDNARYPSSGMRSSKSTRSAPFEYCQGLFQKLGLVEIGETRGLKAAVVGARITPVGSELWSTIAGAYLPWQQENPQLGLTDILGHSQQALVSGSSTRIEIIKFLLDQPAGIATPTEIKRGINRSDGTTSVVTNQLAKIGLLSYRTKHKPAERTFKLSDSTETAERYISRMSPEIRAAVEVLMIARRDDGVELIDGLSIINMIKQHAPTLDAKLAWELFLEWTKNRRSSQPFLEEVGSTTNKTRRTLLGVADENKAALTDFLARREKLATDDKFRLEAKAVGREMLADRLYLSGALHEAKIHSPNQNIDATQWRLHMFEYIPPEGIELNELHRLIQTKTGSRIHQKSFRERIFSMSDLLTFTTASDANVVDLITVVRLRQQKFPSNWAEEARCHSKQIAPQIFSPNDATSQSEKRAGTCEALSYCRKCLGKMACLKTSVVDKGTDQIQGSLTPEQLRKLSRNQKSNIQNTITIKPRFNTRSLADSR
ncbi:MAG: hypothetical protein ABI716_00085 [Candidatus Saccharibacteria bacterium]